MRKAYKVIMALILLLVLLACNNQDEIKIEKEPRVTPSIEIYEFSTVEQLKDQVVYYEHGIDWNFLEYEDQQYLSDKDIEISDYQVYLDDEEQLITLMVIDVRFYLVDEDLIEELDQDEYYLIENYYDYEEINLVPIEIEELSSGGNYVMVVTVIDASESERGYFELDYHIVIVENPYFDHSQIIICEDEEFIGVGTSTLEARFGDNMSAGARELFESMNALRAEYGLAPLEWDGILARLSREHGMDMAHNRFFSHIGSNGSTVRQRIEAEGIRAGRVSEIIARRYHPSSAMNTWVNSYVHRNQILYPNHSHIGIAFYGGVWIAKFVGYR